MRKAVKDPDSLIISDNLKYVSNNARNNEKIRHLLLLEQKNFCSYTDEYISRTDAVDIEHFDPTIKNTPKDNYNNWFIVKHQWNKEKSNKWNDFQPVLHPTADDFEKRIIYLDGDYIASSDTDVEAKNLISLLKLDDPILADHRKRYIKRKRQEIVFAESKEVFFSTLIADDICRVSYPRAIKEEFDIDIWLMLPLLNI